MKSSKRQFYYKNNRMQQLRGFCYAAQHGNISRAAEFMGLGQSSVSLQIKALEEDMGCTLFHRNGPQIALTQDGEKLLAFALPLIDSIEHLPEIFRHELKSKGNATMRIAANNTTKNYLLPGLIRDFIAAHEGVNVEIHYAEQSEAVELIQKNEVDFAFLPRREHAPFPKTLEYFPLFSYKPSLITRPDHPLAGRRNLTVAEISKYPLTLPSEELRVIPNLYDIFPAKTTDNLRLSFIHSETGREYIEAGLLITIASDVWLREKDTLVATPLSHLFADVDYGMVKKRSKNMPVNLQRFIDIATKMAKARKQAA